MAPSQRPRPTSSPKPGRKPAPVKKGTKPSRKPYSK